MEPRGAKLEEFAAETRDRLARIEARLDGVGARMATKADLAALSERMIKWIAGIAIAMSAAVMTFVLNHATPKAPLPSRRLSSSPSPLRCSAPPHP